jgi:hypothetical protein
MDGGGEGGKISVDEKGVGGRSGVGRELVLDYNLNLFQFFIFIFIVMVVLRQHHHLL